MLDIPLQDIITAHTDSLAAHAEEYLPLIRLLLLQGAGPVSPERLATAMHSTRAEIEAFLQLSDFVVDPSGHIHLSPGPHSIYLDGRTFALAGCALDTLVFPLLIGRPARVVSPCPATGRPIRLTVTEQGIEDLDPQGAVVSLRLPGETTSACDVRTTICAYGHFFVDRERASAWPDLHPEAVLLSVEDAAHLAREIANASRRYVEKAAV